MRLLHWSPERLRKNLDTFAQIGTDSEGGITRLSFSNAYREAAECFAALLSEAGLQVHTDPIGNVIGLKNGSSGEKVFMTGSHLDTVVRGGRLDGTLGALAALEYASALQDNHIELEQGLMVVGFAAEEGGPFGGTFGSRAMSGQIDLADPELESKLQEAGINAHDIQAAKIDFTKIAAFLELHIEQGDILFNRRIPLGIVSGIAGITRIGIEIIGESNHAGTTMMDTRRDAVTGFADLVQRAQAIIRADPATVGTFGVVNVFPNMANIIPGKVDTVLELRHQSRAVIQRVIETLEKAAAQIPAVEIRFRILIDKPSCLCAPEIIRCIESVSEELEIPNILMASGAGHDANALSTQIPVGMIFVPSIGGKSHCPDETTEWRDIILGCQVYFDTLLRLDRNQCTSGSNP